MSTVPNSFTAVGAGPLFKALKGKSFTYSLSGTFVATLILEKSDNNGATWEAVITATGAASGTIYVDADANYRWRCSAFTSGTAVTSIDDANDAIQTVQNQDGETVFQINDDGITGKAKNRTYGISLVEMKQGAAQKDNLPDAPDGTNLGLGDTNGNTLTGTTTNGGSTASASETAIYHLPLPAQYVAGEDITLRLKALCSPLATLFSACDVVAAKLSGGSVGSDICATASQNLATAEADYDFTITGDSLNPGDIVYLSVTLATNDTGGTQDAIPKINSLQVIIPEKP